MEDILNPFPGLRPYRLSESHLFFGRRHHAQQIFDKLLAHRFVSVVGNSGSGKSSLVGAGVIPRLNQHALDWSICSFRPAADPLESLSSALIKHLSKAKTENESLGSIAQTLESSALGLVQILRSFQNTSKPILILVDQFEELFRSDNQDTNHIFSRNQQFIDLLLKAIQQQDVPIYVLITLRSDFLGECEAYTGLPEAINNGQYLVPRMQRKDLRECITGPVSVAKKQITPRLVQQLLDELEDKQDQLPVMQHALMRTWEVWKAEDELNSPLDRQHYEQTGGLKEALSQHAEEALAELNATDIKVVELLFKALTDASSLDRGVRRPNTVANLAKIVNVPEAHIMRVADVFRHPTRGFLLPTLDKPLQPETRLDLAHESLMRVWTRLQKWVREESDAAALYKRITESALLFNKGKTGLWRDPDLQIALDWLEQTEPNPYWAKQYNENFETVRYFIQASEKEKWYENKDRKRRRLLVNASVTAALIVLSGLSLWALSERGNAQEKEALALKEKKTAEEQRSLAEEQREIATVNFNKAKEEEQKTLEQKKEAEKQKLLAIQQAQEASKARTRAELGFQSAQRARQLAEERRRATLRQKIISDSLRILADEEKDQSNQLRIRSLAQTIAIKSKLTKANSTNRETKALLALQAFKFNTQAEASSSEPSIMEALLSAMRAYQKDSEYILRQHKDEVLALACSPNEELLASAGSDGQLILTTTTQQNTKKGNLSPLILDNICFSADGKKLALSCDDKSVHMYDKHDLNVPSRTLQNLHKGEITAIAWMNTSIVSVGLDQEIKLTNSVTGQLIQSQTLSAKPLTLAVDVENACIFIGCSDGKLVKVIPGQEESQAIYQIEGDRITALALSHDGSYLAIGTGKGICRVVVPKSCSDAFDLPGHQAGITSLAFHPDNNQLATGCHDGTVRVYNLKYNASNPIEYAEHSSWVLDVAFQNDGKTLFSASRDKTIHHYPTDAAQMVDYLSDKVKRKLTPSEWNRYIGDGIPYEATLQELND